MFSYCDIIQTWIFVSWRHRRTHPVSPYCVLWRFESQKEVTWIVTLCDTTCVFFVQNLVSTLILPELFDIFLKRFLARTFVNLCLLDRFVPVIFKRQKKNMSAESRVVTIQYDCDTIRIAIQAMRYSIRIAILQIFFSFLKNIFILVPTSNFQTFLGPQVEFSKIPP